MSTTDRITTPFGPRSTAAEVIAGIDLTGRRAIVTGGSSGIGTETARVLAAAGADVTITARNVPAAALIADHIEQRTGNDAIAVARLDLSDQRSVAEFADRWSGPLDLLILNAGIMALPMLDRTREGWELQFATNHLGHFSLARRLHPALAAAADGARIVALSSRAHLLSPVVFEDINFHRRPYDPFLAYAQSKTANVLFAVEATRRWGAEGITANAVHPGAILTTNLGRSMDPEELAALSAEMRAEGKTVEQGAATSVLVATSPLLEGVGGRYFEDNNEAVVVDPTADDPPPQAGVAAYALDPLAAARLWDVSLALVD